MPRFWRAIDRPELGSDERFATIGNLIRNRDDVNGLLDDHFSTRKTSEWLARLEDADIFCAPVYNYEQLTTDEQVRANGFVATIDHPRVGPTDVISSPISFSETPAESHAPEPMLGEHTDEVLRGLGYSDIEIETLHSDSVA